MWLFLVRVKWGKEKYDGIQLDTDELPITFKMQLFSLTGILLHGHNKGGLCTTAQS